MPITKGTFNDARLISGGSYSGAADIQDHVWYDTLTMSAATEYLFFQQGQQAGSKPLQDTNLLANGQLPNGQEFVIHSIGVHLQAGVRTGATVPAIVDAFYGLLENSTIQFRIAGREFDLEIPGSVYLPSVSASASTAGANTISRVGDFNNKSWLGLKTPIVIGELVSFNLKMAASSNASAYLTTLAATTASRMKWMLRGTLRRLK
jgi:hypothetical protein